MGEKHILNIIFIFSLLATFKSNAQDFTISTAITQQLRNNRYVLIQSKPTYDHVIDFKTGEDRETQSGYQLTFSMGYKNFDFENARGHHLSIFINRYNLQYQMADGILYDIELDDNDKRIYFLDENHEREEYIDDINDYNNVKKYMPTFSDVILSVHCSNSHERFIQDHLDYYLQYYHKKTINSYGQSFEDYADFFTKVVIFLDELEAEGCILEQNISYTKN